MNLHQAASIVYGQRSPCVGCKGPTHYVDQVLHAGLCAKCRAFITDKVKEQLAEPSRAGETQ